MLYYAALLFIIAIAATTQNKPIIERRIHARR